MPTILVVIVGIFYCWTPLNSNQDPARRIGTGSVLTERPNGAKQSAGPSEERAVDSLTPESQTRKMVCDSGGVPK